MTEQLTPSERVNILTNVCNPCKFSALCSYIRKPEKTPLDCSIAQRYYEVFK